RSGTRAMPTASSRWRWRTRRVPTPAGITCGAAGPGTPWPWDEQTPRSGPERGGAPWRTIAGCRARRRTAFADTVAGRRAVISTDGGRLRLREPKRGPQTKKGRRRYTGAWREPKVLIVYVVDAEGKQEPCFAPFIDAMLQGPD